MAYASLTHDGNPNIWDFSVEVEELSSSGLYRNVRLKVSVNTKDYDYGRNGSYSVSCPDANYTNSWSGSFPGSAQAKIVLINEEFDVYVAPGSTVATIDFSATVKFKSPTTGLEPTAKARISAIQGLTLVADSAISSAKNVYFGDPCSITWTPASSSFTYRLAFSMGEYEYKTDVLRPNTTSAYTYTGLTIPEKEATNIPNSEYGTVAVSLTQYSDSNGSVPVGASSTKSFTITLKDNVIPNINSCVVSIDNSDNDVLNRWGVALSGYTKVNISATASGVYGSSIKSYSITGDYRATVNSNTLNYTGKAISKSGRRSFIISCTDSRGRVSNQVISDSILFLPYSPPNVTKLVLKKEERGDTNPNNDYMVATATWTFDSIDGHNSSSGVIKYKLSTASEWTSYPGTVKNNEPFDLTNLKLEDDASYNFMVVVTDALGQSSSKESFSSVTRVLMDFQSGGMGLGIGKFCEIDNIANNTQSLEVSMDSYFFGDVYIKDKNQKLEDYIKSITKYLVEGEDYGDDDPAHIQWATPPKPGQIYYMKVAEE